MKSAGDHERMTGSTGLAGSIGLPNLITLARLLAVPLVVWLILAGRMAPAFWIFVLAGLSDAADGFIAKRFNCVTEFGRHLDPVADKALLVSVYVALGHAGALPIWLVILVVFRDTLIIGGVLFLRLLNGPVRMQPLFISKINTTMQIVLAAVVIAILGFAVPEFGLIKILTVVVAATTIASGISCLVRWGLGPAGVSSSLHSDELEQPSSSSTEDDERRKERVVG